MIRCESCKKLLDGTNAAPPDKDRSPLYCRKCGDDFWRHKEIMKKLKGSN